MLTGLNFRLPFLETGPTFPLSQLSTARHWQDAESMITERWQSGRSRRTRNAVGRKVPGVRIPPSPPSFPYQEPLGKGLFFYRYLRGSEKQNGRFNAFEISSCFAGPTKGQNDLQKPSVRSAVKFRCVSFPLNLR